MIKRPIVSSLLCFMAATMLASCNTKKDAPVIYSCAVALNDEEIAMQLGYAMLPTGKAEDSLMVEKIKAEISDLLPGKQAVRLKIEPAGNNGTISVYGVTDKNNIDSIACRLFGYSNWNMPDNFVIFFYQDKPVAEGVDGLHAALKKKN